METISALLAICVGNSPVSGEFRTQRPVMLNFDVFFDLRLNNGWVNNGEAGDLRRYRAHSDVNVMWQHPSPKVIPFTKSNGRFFSDTGINMMPSSNFQTKLGRFIEYMLVVISYKKYIDFCYLPVMYRGLKATNVIFSKLSLNIVANFMECYLTDSDTCRWRNSVTYGLYLW